MYDRVEVDKSDHHHHGKRGIITDQSHFDGVTSCRVWFDMDGGGGYNSFEEGELKPLDVVTFEGLVEWSPTFGQWLVGESGVDGFWDTLNGDYVRITIERRKV